MIDTCRICGKLYETNNEEANIPLNQVRPLDRICRECYQANQGGYDMQGNPLPDPCGGRSCDECEIGGCEYNAS